MKEDTDGDLKYCQGHSPFDDVVPDKKPADYCEIGMSSCRCGWQGDYPVSGCPNCHHSFVE
jgi:hypothetical protein